MPCTGCGTEFGIFKKEHGCKNCGYAFCANCLTNKAHIPRIDHRKHSVCSSCYEILSGKRGNEAGGNVSPPAALQRRIDALQQKQGEHSKNEALALRLSKLREEKRGKIPTEKELEERLARLKDMPSAPQSSQMLHKRDNRTAVEQSSDLMKQYSDEIRLDASKPKPEDEITRRLQRLRGEEAIWNDLNNPGHSDTDQNATNFSTENSNAMKPDTLQNFPRNIAGNSNENLQNVTDIDEVHKLMEAARRETQANAERAIREIESDTKLQNKLMELKANRNRVGKSLPNNEESDDDDQDENKLADKLIEKLLAEDLLDESAGYSRQREKKEINTPNSENSTDSEELPWCTICNEDATLRCRGCDGDLYCQRCFKEGHDSVETKTHSTIVYKAPKRQE